MCVWLANWLFKANLILFEDIKTQVQVFHFIFQLFKY